MWISRRAVGRQSRALRSLFRARNNDLTSTYFECDRPEADNDPRQFGYSRDRRSDCVQVVIAMVVTPEGLPLAYEMMPGNAADKNTLPTMIALVKKRHGQIGRIWVMNRGIPTEDALARMRAAIRRCIIWWARRRRGFIAWKRCWPTALGWKAEFLPTTTREKF